MTSSHSSNGHHKFHLFLSPHMDDAILSCGGQIAQLVAAGHTVVIHTIMAGKPGTHLPDSAIVQDLHTRWRTPHNPVAERRREDIRAARRLGALSRHGTIPDCVYRVVVEPGGTVRALYPSEEALWGPVHPADPAPLLLDAMPLFYPQTDVLHVPLGVGGHVDHRLVRDWGRRLARVYSDTTTLYYEEYPYNRDPAALDRALAAFDAQALEPILVPLDETALTAKIDAVRCYESQISTFWADVDAMAAGLRADALALGAGVPAEREWRPGV